VTAFTLSLLVLFYRFIDMVIIDSYSSFNVSISFMLMTLGGKKTAISRVMDVGHLLSSHSKLSSTYQSFKLIGIFMIMALRIALIGSGASSLTRWGTAADETITKAFILEKSFSFVSLYRIYNQIIMTDTRQPAIKKCTSIELKAIYSRTLKSAHKLAEGIPGILLASDEGNENEKNDLASVIVSDEIDAVIIA
jgi:hypothetical protein